VTASLRAIARNPSGGRLLAAALLLTGLSPATRAADPHVERFEIGLARSCFPNINVNDALAAYRVMLKSMGARLGYTISPSVTIYEDTPRFAAAIKRGTMHLAVMDAWQFLDLELYPEIRPFFVPAINGQVGRRYVVLARRGSGIRTIADLRGRAVVRLESINNNVCRRWLETLLPNDHPDATGDFFAALESATKPTAAVLPVFFGQKAACIVDEGSFNLMKELNPQVGRDLEVVVASALFVDIIICLGERGWPSPGAKADTVKTLSDLGADPFGRQVLSLFRISGQVAFKDEQLATVRALRRTAEELQEARHAGGDPP